jgi:hypothetical protein
MESGRPKVTEDFGVGAACIRQGVRKDGEKEWNQIDDDTNHGSPSACEEDAYWNSTPAARRLQ